MRAAWFVAFWLASAPMLPGQAEAQSPPAPPLDGSPEVSRAKLECWERFRMGPTPYESYAECSRAAIASELRTTIRDASFIHQLLAQRTSLYGAVDTGTIKLEEALRVMKATLDTKYREEQRAAAQSYWDTLVAQGYGAPRQQRRRSSALGRTPTRLTGTAWPSGVVVCRGFRRFRRLLTGARLT